MAHGEISRNTALSVLDRFFSFFLYATSWHRAEVPDTLLNRSPTDFSFLHHLVAHFCLSFFTPPRDTEQKSPTHCSNGPRPTFVFFGLFLHHLVAHFFFFFNTTSWHRAEVLDALLKRSTTTMWPDKQDQTPLSEHNGP